MLGLAFMSPAYTRDRGSTHQWEPQRPSWPCGHHLGWWLQRHWRCLVLRCLAPGVSPLATESRNITTAGLKAAIQTLFPLNLNSLPPSTLSISLLPRCQHWLYPSLMPRCQAEVCVWDHPPSPQIQADHDHYIYQHDHMQRILPHSDWGEEPGKWLWETGRSCKSREVISSEIHTLHNGKYL